MFEDLKATLAKAETKGDVAVVLGAGTVGFVVDGLLSGHGLFSPGVVSGLSATGALSAKKAWDSVREAKRAKKAAAKALEKVTDAVARAEKLQVFFTERGYEVGVQEMVVHLDLRKQGLIDDARLYQATEAALDDYLAHVRKPKQ